MIVGSPTILNLVPGGVMKCVHVNQVNKNIEIQFKVMNGAAPYNLPEGVTCTIRGTKGDAFGYAAEAAVTAGSNVVTVTLTEQLTAVAGAGNIFELVFVGAADDMKVSTENFILAVERQAMGEDTVISDSDLSYAQQVLDSLQNVAAVNAQVQQNKANLAAEISRAQAAEATETAARQAADNTLQSNINAEASTRATQDASLQSQINQLVAPEGAAPSAAEIENARVGADGTVYPTLGDAIRTQNNQLKSAIDYSLKYVTDISLWVQNAINANTGSNYNSANTIKLKERLSKRSNLFAVKVLTGKIGLHAWDSDATYLGFWKNGTFQKSGSVSAAFVLTGEIDLTQFYDLGYTINIEYRTDDNADITPDVAYDNVEFARSIAVDNTQTLEDHDDAILHQIMTDVTKNFVWQQGYIDPSGNNGASNNYIRTRYQSSIVDIITVEQDLIISVVGYDNNSNFVGDHLDDTGTCVITKDLIPGATFYRFEIGKRNGSATLDDVDKIKIYYKDDLNAFVKDVNSKSIWEIGGIGSDGINWNNRNWNIRTGYLENVHKITVAEGYAVDVSTYDENKQWMTRRQNYTGDIYVDYAVWKCKYIRIELISGDTTPLTNVDMYSNVGLYAYLDTKLELDGLAADSDAVGKRFDAQFTNWMSQSRYSDTTDARIVTLMHFSDIHNNLSAMKKAVSLIEQYSAKIDDAIHTGDVTLTNLGQGILNWIQSGCADTVLGVVGNHDTYANSGLVLNSATQEAVYNTLFANYISGWNVVQPTGVDDAESDYYCACYYYKDYTTPKIRLIVLDSERWDENELAWFTATLDDAKTNGYAVVVASHCAPGAVTGLHGNWNYIGVENFDSSTPTYATITEDAPNAIDAFVSAGGEFVLWISGHFHRGGFGHLVNHPNIFVMVAEKASIDRTSGAARISGESNEYAFNMLSVDASDKLVRMVRYGSNADAWLRPRNVFTYNYDSHTVIYEG